MADICQNSKVSNASETQTRVSPFDVSILGVTFQAFLHPEAKQPVFSQTGLATGFKMSRTTAARWLREIYTKRSQGKGFSPTTLNTTVSSTPITVVTMADLSAFVQLAAERGNIVARSILNAGNAIIIQQSVDEALGIERQRSEYLGAGKKLRHKIETQATPKQRFEYKNSYHSLKNKVFEEKRGVRGLCKINRNISAITVSDADARRELTPHWRKKCSGEELSKITIGNLTVQRALDAGAEPEKAYERIEAAFSLLDAPF